MKPSLFVLSALSLFAQDVTYWVHPGLPVKGLIEDAKPTFNAYGLNLVQAENASSASLYVGFVPYLGPEHALLLKGPNLEVTLYAFPEVEPESVESTQIEVETEEEISEPKTMLIGLLNRDTNWVTHLFSSTEEALTFKDAYPGVAVELKPFDRIRDLSRALEQKKVEYIICSKSSQALLASHIELMTAQEVWPLEMGVFLGRDVQASMAMARLTIQTLNQPLDNIANAVRKEAAEFMRLTNAEQGLAYDFWAEGWETLWSAPIHDQAPCLTNAFERGRTIIPSKREAVPFTIVQPGDQ